MAKKRIGAVRVDLIATSGAFTAGIKRARRSLKKFGDGVHKIAAHVRKGMKIMLATGTALGVGLSIVMKRTFADIDRIGKTASKLGIGTEALTRFHYAAQLSGVEVRTFDMALQRMTRRLSEAAMDTGEAKDALIELGINAKRLSKLGPEAALFRIAEAFQQIVSPADRVRLAFKLFDSEGVAMVNVIGNGIEALKAIGKESDLVGYTMQADTTRLVEDANNKVTAIKALFTGMFRTLAGEMAPFVGAAATAFKDWATSGEGASSKIVDAFEDATMAVATFWDTLERRKAQTGTFAKRFVAAGATVARIAGKLVTTPSVERPLMIRRELDRLGKYYVRSAVESAKTMSESQDKVRAAFARIREAAEVIAEPPPEPEPAKGIGRAYSHQAMDRMMRTAPWMLEGAGLPKEAEVAIGLFREQVQQNNEIIDILREPETELEIP